MTVIEQLNAGDSFTLTEVQENSFHGKPRRGASPNRSVVFSYRKGFSADEWAPAVTLPALAANLSTPEGLAIEPQGPAGRFRTVIRNQFHE